MARNTRRWIAATTLVLCTGLSAGTLANAADTTTATPSAETSASCSRTLASYPVVQPGARGTAVRTLQCLLNDSHYAPTPLVVDGIYGRATRRAVSAMEKDLQWPPGEAGVVGPGGWTLLHARTMTGRTLRVGSTGTDVIKLQRALRAAGATTIAIDGRYGPATARWVRGYQQENALHVDGIVGVRTWSALKTGITYILGD